MINYNRINVRQRRDTETDGQTPDRCFTLYAEDAAMAIIYDSGIIANGPSNRVLSDRPIGMNAMYITWSGAFVVISRISSYSEATKQEY